MLISHYWVVLSSAAVMKSLSGDGASGQTKHIGPIQSSNSGARYPLGPTGRDIVSYAHEDIWRIEPLICWGIWRDKGESILLLHEEIRREINYSSISPELPMICYSHYSLFHVRFQHVFFRKNDVLLFLWFLSQIEFTTYFHSPIIAILDYVCCLSAFWAVQRSPIEMIPWSVFH